MHDIGKNIVGVVLQCNNYEVIDLGVMVPCGEDPGDGARPKGVDIIGLSGLITPSLDEMVHVADGDEAPGLHAAAADRRRDDLEGAHGGEDRAALRRRRWSTCSTRRARSASPATCCRDERGADYVAQGRATSTTRCARRTDAAGRPADGAACARGARANRATDRLGGLRAAAAGPRSGHQPLFDDYDLAELVERIDWTPFFQTWELAGHFPDILDDPVVGEAARSVFADAQAMLQRIVGEKWLRADAVIGFWPANTVGEDDIEVFADEDALGRARHRSHAAPADGARPGRPGQPGARRLHRAEGRAASPTGSAASP